MSIKGKGAPNNPIDKTVRCKYCGGSKVKSSGIFKTKTNNDKRSYKCHDCAKYFSVPIHKLDELRVLVMSDLHCGHITGLTPPQYQQTNNGLYGEFQKESWIWFVNMIERLKPIDVLIVNGDLIDGRQEKSGGEELIIGNRGKQVKMAVECINAVGAKKIYITRGTPYHTGKEENWEDLIKDGACAESISSYLKLSINGCLFDVRHKTGRSNIPHGRFTMMARTAMWNDLMNETDAQKANVIIRSHVHYHIFGGHSNNRIFMTTPGMQGQSEYGLKECEGNVDYGMIHFDITENGIVKDWKFYKAHFKTNLNEIQTVKF